jgi:hypothetical protein
MSKNYLPFDLVVDATISKFTNFSAKESFQTLLVLSVSENETQRAKVAEYSSYDEAVKDNATESVKSILAVVFGQENRPNSVKVAYVDATANIKDELDRISVLDTNWVFLGIDDAVSNSDIAIAANIADWAGASKKIVGLIDKNPNALNKNETSLTQSFRDKRYGKAFSLYAPTTEKANAIFGMFAYMASRNFDEPNSFYTSKFKTFSGVEATSLTSDEYKQLSGFVRNQGLDKAVGNLGNVYTSIGNTTIVMEGNTASGELISVEHGMLWLEFTIQYEVMNVFTNNPVVPYTNKGVGMILSALQLSLDLAVKAGLLVDYSISTEDVLAVPESKRANHIAPPISWSGRLSGAIHYTSINGAVKY